MAQKLILIVEDNAKNLKLIRDLLQFKGYATLEAETGQAGIALARERHPALVLMDVQLPDIDGRTAMQALKGHDDTRSIPVIALTAFAMKGDGEAFLADGFDGYISKPIEVKEFPTLIARYLDSSPKAN